MLPLAAGAKQHTGVYAIRVLRNLADDDHPGIVHGNTGDVGIAVERELRHLRHLRAWRLCSAWAGGRIDVTRVAKAKNAISGALLFASQRALCRRRAQQQAGCDKGGGTYEPHLCEIYFVYNGKTDSHMMVRSQQGLENVVGIGKKGSRPG